MSDKGKTSITFGPEWMRPKQSIARAVAEQASTGNAAQMSNASTYSAHVSPAQPSQSDEHDEMRPFRYSKDEMLQIYRDGAGQAGLGLEVERWDGVVREVSREPTSVREMGDAEKKLFAGSLNSDLRRRQSTDFLSPLSTQNLGIERPRLNHSTSATAGSPLRDRFGTGLGRRRGDSTDQIPGTLPRKLSLSSTQTPLSPRDTGMPPPRVPRMGFDGGVFGGGGESWTARRRASEGVVKTPGAHRDTTGESHDEKIKEEDEIAALTSEPQTAIDIEPSASADSSQNVDTTISQLTISENHHNASPSPANNSTGASPPGLTDLASVEWSYLDPQGNTQGPFRADLMQKWHDDGYFQPELRMKRSRLDTDWTTVADLRQRASGPLFLSPHRSPIPPGLPSHTPTFTGVDPFNPPYQPAPIRSLRSTTLDSFLGGSNPSDSPSSSLGAGRYSNDSPDPMAFGGRASNFAPGPDIAAIGRQNVYYEAPVAQPHVMPTRSTTLDNGYASFGHSPWQNANGSIGGFDSGRGSTDVLQYNPYHESRIPSSFNNGISQDMLPGGYAPRAFEEQRMQQSLHDTSTFNPSFSVQPSLQQNVQSSFPPQAIQPELGAHTSPWSGAPEAPGPFDSSFSTSTSTLGDPSPSPWGVASSLPRAPITKMEKSPWAAPRPAAETRSHGTINGLPALNGQHLEMHPELSPDSTVLDPNTAPLAKKARTKTTNVKPSFVSSHPFDSSSPSESPVVVDAPKPAWAKTDDAKPSGVSLSLREIQDAEAKRVADSRKTLEKERDRVRATAAPAEDVQAFTSSWGLPTSQAGGRVALKDNSVISTPVAGSPSAAVWTNTIKAPAAKKTMKEIQEEEEKRKKVAVKESLASVAARRGYAETTVKTSAAPAQGGAWTTVGPSGKGSPLATVPPRPTVTTPASSTASSLPRGTGTPTIARPPAAGPTPTKPAPPGKEEYPAAPSHEFLKWLSEALQGLNKSVNVEEIIQMLLSFSIDPDSSTVELISEMIYSNSTILDGRRFAADFVSKRKIDAAARAKGGPSTMALNKPISIADVVKAQPKQQTSEWGGFKVVNKKKKGGRS